MWFKKQSREKAQYANKATVNSLHSDVIELNSKMLGFIAFLHKYPTLNCKNHYDDCGFYEVEVMLGTKTVAYINSFNGESYSYRLDEDFEPTGNNFSDKKKKCDEFEKSLEKYISYIYRYMV